MTAKIYYDGDCPFCTKYVGLINLRKAVGDVDLINLREDDKNREALTREGFDLDQGLVVDLDGKRVGGADATHLLATLSTSSNTFNRLNHAIFSRPLLSATFYPAMRSGRWLTMFLLGRRTINDNDPLARQRQQIFAMLFAFFSLFHVFNYLFKYGRLLTGLDLVVLFVCALAVLRRPSSERLLFLLVLVSTVSTVIQAPINSNHTMLRSMILIGYWLSFLYALIRARPYTEIFGNFVLAGRGALLVMYVFGIFHKINWGFLDPTSSFAARLWDEMLPPLSWMQSVYIDYAGIYATFLIEGLLILALLNPRTRHIGMVGGIAFHVFLSFSNYAAYISFTTLTIAAHVLFLSRAQLDRVSTSDELAWLRLRADQWQNKLAFLLVLVCGAFFMLINQYNLTSLCMLPAVLTVCSLVLRYGREIPDDATREHSVAAKGIGLCVTVLFFANCMMPYVGLKTAQTMNMFSNLRLEGGVSNHLVFSNPPRLFGYLEDVAVVTAKRVGEERMVFDDPTFGTVYYDLLAEMADNPDTDFSFTLNGDTYEDVSASDFQDEINETLHVPFVRKFFHFSDVILLEQPRGQ